MIQITVTGTGYYKGSDQTPATMTGTYRILSPGHDISKAKIQLKPQMYEDEVLIEEQSCLEKAYVKNGKVTFEGIGEVGETKTVTFKIVPKVIEDK